MDRGEGRRRRAWRFALAIVPAVAGWSLDSRAGDASWLEWSAPAGCPVRGDIERRVTKWLGNPLPDDGELFVHTQLVRSGRRWNVAIEISLRGQTGERRVTVSSCEAAAEFVAIAVVLAVDPSLAAGLEHRADELPVHPEPRDTEEPRKTPEPAPRKVEPQRNLPADGEEVPASDPRASQHEEARGWNWRGHASGAGVGAWGTLPRATPGADLQLGGDHGPWSMGLGVRWLLPVTVSPDRAVAPIDFSWFGARAVFAYRLLGPAVEVGPALAVEGGIITADQQGRSAENPVSEPWWALGLGAQAFVELSGRLSLMSELEMTVPIAQPVFVLSDDSEVYRVGLGARAALGVRVFFNSR